MALFLVVPPRLLVSLSIVLSAVLVVPQLGADVAKLNLWSKGAFLLGSLIVFAIAYLIRKI